MLPSAGAPHKFKSTKSIQIQFNEFDWLLIEFACRPHSLHQWNSSPNQFTQLTKSAAELMGWTVPLGPNAFKFNQSSINLPILKEKIDVIDEFDWRGAVILFIFIKIIHNWFHQQVNSINYFIFISYSKYYPYCYNNLIVRQLIDSINEINQSTPIK